MAITTLKGHVSRAIDFYNKPEIFFGIGKTTPWGEADRTTSTPDDAKIDDYNPPVPEPTDEIMELAGFKRAETVYLCVQDDNKGEIVYQEKRWRVIPLENAYDEGARWVYIAAQFAYSEFAFDISYRQVGLYTGIKRNENVPSGQFVLKPDEVADIGMLEVLDNRRPIYRMPDQREGLTVIVEF